MQITDQSDRPVFVPNLNGPVIAWLVGGHIHGLLIGWTLDLSASADVLVSIDKEKAVSRPDLLRYVVYSKRHAMILAACSRLTPAPDCRRRGFHNSSCFACAGSALQRFRPDLPIQPTPIRTPAPTVRMRRVLQVRLQNWHVQNNQPPMPLDPEQNRWMLQSSLWIPFRQRRVPGTSADFGRYVCVKRTLKNNPHVFV